MDIKFEEIKVNKRKSYNFYYNAFSVYSNFGLLEYRKYYKTNYIKSLKIEIN
jgi:hypothetical protein